MKINLNDIKKTKRKTLIKHVCILLGLFAISTISIANSLILPFAIATIAMPKVAYDGINELKNIKYFENLKNEKEQENAVVISDYSSEIKEETCTNNYLSNNKQISSNKEITLEK